MRERLVALKLREIARELADVMRGRRHLEARERTLRSVQMNLLRGRITVAEANTLLQANDLDL